jgi:hypothetical protein
VARGAFAAGEDAITFRDKCNGVFLLFSPTLSRLEEKKREERGREAFRKVSVAK